ncbi:MAG TPA: YgiT-type zinc finger protein [Anaerolineae bacterium]|nr:YgiT-type zinc finger protein [Anaerolineae bacterium]
MSPQRVSYFTMQDGHVICVPDFAAMVCDACGRREYDPDALAELHAMLATDRRSRRQHRLRQHDGERTHQPKTADHRRPV